jgi:putative phosphoesterase
VKGHSHLTRSDGPGTSSDPGRTAGSPLLPASIAASLELRTGCLVGVISDTHGYVDPQIPALFREVDCIIHAGDIGSAAVLACLGEVAPVHAVRGNVDRAPQLLAIPEQLVLTVDDTELLVVHRVQDGVPRPQTRIVVSGHSHRPNLNWRDRILYLNPGAAGLQGFHRDRTVSLLQLTDPPEATLLTLGPRSARSN